MSIRPPHRRPSSPYCRRWLVAYWTAASFNLLFLVLALTGQNVPIQALFAVGTGAIAAVLGTAMASHMVRRGIGDRDFDEATSSMRIVCVGWLLLVLVMLIGVAAGSEMGTRDSAGGEATGEVLAVSDSIVPALFGVAALFVVVGDGYTKYRRQLVAKSPR